MRSIRISGSYPLLIRFFVFLAFLCIFLPFFSIPFGQAQTEKVLEIPQGEIYFLIETEKSGEKYLSVSCFDRTIPFFGMGKEGEVGALIAVDLAQSQKKYVCEMVKVDSSGSTILKNLVIRVVDGGFRTQELSVPRKMVDLDPSTLKRVKHEKSAVDRLWNSSMPKKLWNGDFVLPVKGEARGSFGLRRVFNGQPRNPHTGEDFGAPLGEAVVSSNRGIIKLVGDHFFSGKSIFIDHGLGVYTMYFHLSEILVEEGSTVEKGGLIGRVGATGRATGPHLHWGLRLNNARVNPLSMTKFSLQ